MLEQIFSRSQAGYAIISTKGKTWEDKAFKSTDLAGIARYVKANAHKDIYFCPLLFSVPRRSKQHVLPSSILWSDMDTCDPTIVPPSILWESSPGRHHGIWFLDRTLPREDWAILNKKLSYHIGADKGGWDLTQVLRIPGTLNYKYTPPEQVTLISENKKVYSVSWLRHKLISLSELIKKYRVPKSLAEILMQPTVSVGERSDKIWYLENKLHEQGLKPHTIIQLIKHSAWNKYRGRSDEETRLKSELEKILEGEFEEEPFQLILTPYSQVMGSCRPKPGWLVEGFWMHKSGGLIVGEPKSFKTTLALDLAVSIASGEPFLDQFRVRETGPVLFIQNENSPWILRENLSKIVDQKGLHGQYLSESMKVQFGQNLPIHFVNQQGFKLTDPAHLDSLEHVVNKIRPVMVFFDPLYLMFDKDLNSAQDLGPVLQWLIQIRSKYESSIALIHHFNKKREVSHISHRTMGSNILQAWWEVAWYISVKEAEDSADDVNEEIEYVDLEMDRRFRAAGIMPKVNINLTLKGKYEATASLVNRKKKLGDKELKIVELLREKPLTQRQIGGKMGIELKEVYELVDSLIAHGKVKREKSLVTLL